MNCFAPLLWVHFLHRNGGKAWCKYIEYMLSFSVSLCRVNSSGTVLGEDLWCESMILPYHDALENHAQYAKLSLSQQRRKKSNHSSAELFLRPYNTLGNRAKITQFSWKQKTLGEMFLNIHFILNRLYSAFPVHQTACVSWRRLFKAIACTDINETEDAILTWS